MSVYRVDKLMAEARKLAAAYRRETGKALAVSGEIAVSDAVNLLQLEPAADDAVGYDAWRERDGNRENILIKARVIFSEQPRTHRLGQLKLDSDWQILMLVVLNEEYETDEIWEVGRDVVDAQLAEQAANRRGTLTVARIRHIGELAWAREDASPGGAG